MRYFFRTGHYHHRRTGYHGILGSSHRAEIRKKGSAALSAGDHRGTLRKGDEAICGEEAMEEKLKTARIVVADPLYRPICPKTAIFYEMPHIAFSGRIYLRKYFSE